MLHLLVNETQIRIIPGLMQRDRISNGCQSEIHCFFILTQSFK